VDGGAIDPDCAGEKQDRSNFTGILNRIFTTGWHTGGLIVPRRMRGSLDSRGRLEVHQASILMTAFVMIMAGAWIAMYELSGQEAQAEAAVAVESAN
jgi:hypothetical protein